MVTHLDPLRIPLVVVPVDDRRLERGEGDPEDLRRPDHQTPCLRPAEASEVGGRLARGEVEGGDDDDDEET